MSQWQFRHTLIICDRIWANLLARAASYYSQKYTIRSFLVRSLRARRLQRANTRGEHMPDILTPNQAADFLLSESREQGEILTNLKLQKLLYYAQAWFLALEDRALFSEDFQAWAHGPVLPSQYRRFREFAWRPLTVEVAAPQIADEAVRLHLESIIEEFGTETAVALERMTHRESPWIDARNGLPNGAASDARISKESMKKYYRDLTDKD